VRPGGRATESATSFARLFLPADCVVSSLHVTDVSLIPLFEKRGELRRILSNRLFSNSPKKTRFLEFVCEQTFVGNGDKLNEYQIGVEVYERGVDFNPQRDPIVRVQAYEIRRLLKRYYEQEEGSASPLRMDLPAGHYVPVFMRNSEPEAAPEESTVLLTASERQRPERLPWTLTVVLGILCVVLAGLLALSWGRRNVQSGARAASLPESLQWFWQPFLGSGEGPLITIPNHPLLRAAHDGDSPQTIAAGHEIAKSDLPEFRDTIHFHELKRFIFVPSLTDFTSVGETLGVVDLCQMFSRVGQRCRVQQSRLANLDEIKGDDTILLGGNQAWSGRVFLNREGFQFHGGIIFNSKPKPGEQTEYKPEFDSVTNHLIRDYALVLMLPNQTKDKRILLIYGIYTQGSQAAIEYLTNPERVSELRKALTDTAPDHRTIPLYFQLLLTTTVENAVPGRSSLVAVRIIPG